MIITDYYKFERLDGQKSKTRVDCVLSTGKYPELEVMRNKHNQLFFYYGEAPVNFKTKSKRKADKAITKQKNLSSVYFNDIEQPYAFGDFAGSCDALLFIVTDTEQKVEIEMFICRGKKSNKQALCNLLQDGELNEEIEYFRNTAVKEELICKEQQKNRD